MKFFNMEYVHPLILWEILTKKDQRDEFAELSGYLSPAGKECYDAADTPGKKIQFFFEYLDWFAAKNGDHNVSEKNSQRIYKLAIVMALTAGDDAMTLEEYQDMLDPKKNFLVQAAGDSSVSGEELLAKLHGKTDGAVYRASTADPLAALTVYEQGKTDEKLYKLEKLIIAFFFDDADGALGHPYSYNYRACD